MPKRPSPFLIFRKFEILKLCFKVGMWGTKRSVLVPWAKNITCWSSQMHEFRPNGENVEICEIWQKPIFWKNCSTLGLRGAKRSALSPRAQKTYFEPPQIGKNTETVTPFLIFQKFEILELSFNFKFGMWGTKRIILAPWARNSTCLKPPVGWISPKWRKCWNLRNLAKKLFFEKLFYTRLMGYQKKRIVLLSSEKILWTNPWPDWQKYRNFHALFWLFENFRFWNFVLR